MPVPCGNQHTPAAHMDRYCVRPVILGVEGLGPRVTAVTCGKIVDKGITDVNNMGAATASWLPLLFD